MASVTSYQFWGFLVIVRVGFLGGGVGVCFLVLFCFISYPPCLPVKSLLFGVFLITQCFLSVEALSSCNTLPFHFARIHSLRPFIMK